jgi:hypothetical protein
MKTSQLPHRPRRIGAGLALMALLLGAQLAQAGPPQRCQADGRLVLQAGPCAGAPPAAATPLRPTLVAAEPAEDVSAAPKKRTLADIMREREEENRARTKAREPQVDGARILRDRMGAL